jgi:predicted glycoside hydrolase/deacetylase ChbG (UPF0249 family)
MPAIVNPEPINAAMDAASTLPKMKKPSAISAHLGDELKQGHLFVLNADDWGRTRETTDRILDCVVRGAVSATSAMVFMEDSERAAAIAREHGVDAGLHLNLTAPFSAPGCSTQLSDHQQRLSRYLRRSRMTRIIFNPGLANSFQYVVRTQLDEFRRLYGHDPEHLDGHHHMHLATNVLLGKLLPAKTIVRRSFSFRRGEKGLGNRLYRKWVDGRLVKRHYLADFFFALEPVHSETHLQRIFAFGGQGAVVEIETHPVNQDEYQFLSEGRIFRWMAAGRIRSFRQLLAAIRA